MYVFTLHGETVARFETIRQAIEVMVTRIVQDGPIADRHSYDVYDGSDIQVASVQAIHVDMDRTFVTHVDVSHHGVIERFYPPYAENNVQSYTIGV